MKTVASAQVHSYCRKNVTVLPTVELSMQNIKSIGQFFQSLTKTSSKFLKSDLMQLSLYVEESLLSHYVEESKLVKTKIYICSPNSIFIFYKNLLSAPLKHTVFVEKISMYN